MDVETFQRACEIHAHRRLCTHEAAHASAALLSGLDVGSAEAGFYTFDQLEDCDPDETSGVVRIRCDDHRAGALCVLAALVEDDRVPSWPLSAATPDERSLGENVKALALDRTGYADLVQDAYALVCSRPYELLRTAIEYALEQHGRLDHNALLKLKAIAREESMEHVTFKAAVTTTARDLGEFEAVISTEAVDREKDIVSADAMVAALRAWNRPLPLTWGHSTNAEDIIGTIDPQSVRAVNGEVVASGHVDVDSRVGQEAWRSFKSRSVGFSFGYLIIDATKRAGGGRHITALDVFEVSGTPVPANNDTRVLSTKAIAERSTMLDAINAAFARADAERTADELRMKSKAIAREHAPIQIASFDA